MENNNATRVLTLEDLRRLSHVARIHLDEAQEQRHLDSLNAMLALAQELEELPMHVGNYPVAFTLEEMREDAPLESTPRELLLAQSAYGENGYFAVPRIMEKQE